MLHATLSTEHPPARIVAQHRGAYVVTTEPDHEEHWAELSGRFRHDAVPAGELPAVGDLVALRSSADRLIIDAVLPRASVISRNAAGGRTDEQVLAANVDLALLAIATNLDRFASRVERYIVAAWDSGATPVIVITKADLCADIDAIIDELATVAVGVTVVVTSSLHGDGIADLRAQMHPDRIGVLLGPSGVGKSSLVNALVADANREVKATRAHDKRGRHTTTSRALIELPGGGAIIDTPGLREFKLWDEAGVERAFDDIIELGTTCRFSDCRHTVEPGCAIQAALETGALDAERYGRYLRLKREAEAHALKRNRRAMLEARKEWIRRSAYGEERRRLKGNR